MPPAVIRYCGRERRADAPNINRIKSAISQSKTRRAKEIELVPQTAEKNGLSVINIKYEFNNLHNIDIIIIIII